MSIYQEKFVFYVYAYIRDDGTPYYTGKGKNRRCYALHGSISRPSSKKRIIILESNLSEIGAFALERRMILWYGRKDIGTGILRNRTDGGDGASGAKRTAEHKKIISETHKGNTVWVGRKHSESTKQKISAAQKGIAKTSEHCKKLSEIRRTKEWYDKVFTEEWSRNRSLNYSGKNHPLYGIKRPKEWNDKVSESCKNIPKIECEHCKKLSNPGNYVKWHGKNCKTIRNLKE